MSLPRPLLLAAALAALVPGPARPAAPAAALAPAPPFEVLPSTRRVTRLLPLGSHFLVGTTGGVVVLGPGGRRLLLPGVPIRALVPDPADPAAALAATDAGPARIRADRAELLGTGACSALAVDGALVLVVRPDGTVEDLSGATPARKVPCSAPIQALVAHRGVLRAAGLDGIRVLSGAGAGKAESIGSDPLAAHVTALAALSDHLYAGTPVGLFERTDTAWQPVPQVPKFPPHVTSLALDGRGVLVVGTAGDGTWRLEGGRLRPFAREPAVVTALGLWKGALWAGTDDAGAVPLDRPQARPSLGPDEPPSNAITSLAFARDWQTLAVGTFDRGVGLRTDGTWRRAGLGAGLPSDWVNQVASDGNRVLARLSDGNVMASKGSADWVALGKADGWPKAWTGALGSDRGRLWVGTRNAFYLSSQAPWEIYAPKPELDGVDVLDVALRETETWIATHRHGLLRWDRWRRKFERLTHGSGLPDPWVTCVEVFRGRVFAGTFDGGLVEVEDQGPGSPLGTVRTVPVGPGGLPSPAVETLLATDDALWVGTLEGLAVTRDGRTFRPFGLPDGLPSPHITGLADDGTHLWVGTPAGLARAPLAALAPPAGGAP